MEKKEGITQELMIYKIGINALTFLKKEEYSSSHFSLFQPNIESVSEKGTGN